MDSPCRKRTDLSRWTVLAAALLLGSIVSCNDDGSTGPDDTQSVSIAISPTSATLGTTESTTFTVTVTGTTNTGVTWSATCGTLSGQGSTINYTAPPQPGSCTVTAASQADPSKSASATVTVNNVVVTIDPVAIELRVGESTTFSATVTGANNTGVSWSATCGTLSSQGNTGNYTAPSQPGSCTVMATSQADPSKSASATVTVIPLEIVVTVQPSSLTLPTASVTAFTATVTGTTNTAVTWSATCGTIFGSGETINWMAPTTPGTCVITATSVENPTKSGSATVTVNEVVVTIEPTEVTLLTGQSTTFTATVTGTVNTAVTWDADCGTIDGTGSTVTYTAPGTATTCTVTATSQADATKSASATVTVNEVVVTIDPPSVELLTGESTTFTALVGGTDDTAVTWSATCGAIAGTGTTVTYTAPGTAGTCTITATSQADPTKSASATVTVSDVVVSISSAAITLLYGQTTQFTASVSGASGGVTWSTTCGVFTSTSGSTAQYRAPGQTGTCQVTATSAAYPTRSATAVVNVRYVQPLENLIGNGTFDSDILGWTVIVDGGTPRAAWSNVDANGSGSSGSAEAYNPSTNTGNGLHVALTACIPVTAGQRIVAGATARMVNVVAGGQASPQFWVRAHSNASCTAQVASLFEISFQPYASSTNWVALAEEAVVPPGATHVLIQMGVRKHQTGLAVDATGQFDNVYVRVVP